MVEKFFNEIFFMKNCSSRPGSLKNFLVSRNFMSSVVRTQGSHGNFSSLSTITPNLKTCHCMQYIYEMHFHLNPNHPNKFKKIVHQVACLRDEIIRSNKSHLLLFSKILDDANQLLCRYRYRWETQSIVGNSFQSSKVTYLLLSLIDISYLYTR